MVEVMQNGVPFDLGAMERELRRSEPYVREGHTAHTLVHSADMRVVLIVIRSGNRIPAHHANESAVLHAVSGHLRVHVEGRIVELPTGHIVALTPGTRHDVETATDSAFVLTLGWPPT